MTDRDLLLKAERETHKEAARTWFNLLTELWPPENTEEYWSKAVVRLNEVWNGSTDNPLLMKLLLLTHEYLGEAVKRAEEKEEHDKAGG